MGRSWSEKRWPKTKTKTTAAAERENAADSCGDGRWSGAHSASAVGDIDEKEWTSFSGNWRQQESERGGQFGVREKVDETKQKRNRAGKEIQS